MPDVVLHLQREPEPCSVAERLAETIRAAGYTLNIVHRDMSGHSEGVEAEGFALPDHGERLPA